MKKQKIVLASATVAIMVILLGYYLAPLVTGYSRVTFEVVTTAGDETLIDDVQFLGNVNKWYDYETVIITNDETNYKYSESNLSSYVGQELLITHLIDRYPSFVRGKTAVSENFYETADKITYVENYSRSAYNQMLVSKIQLPISVFDKETGVEIENEITIEGAQPFNYAHVYNFMMLDDYLVLDVAIDWLDDQMQTIVYDWKKGEIVNTFHKSSDTRTMDYNHNFQNYLVNEAEKTLLIRETTFMEDDTRYTYSLFSLQDGKRQELEFPDSFYQKNNLFYASKEGVFALTMINDELIIEKFDLESQTVMWKKVLPLDIDDYVSDLSHYSLMEINGSLLLSETYMDNAQDNLQFMFLDLEDFGILAEGYIEMTDADNTADGYFEAITYME